MAFETNNKRDGVGASGGSGVGSGGMCGTTEFQQERLHATPNLRRYFEFSRFVARLWCISVLNSVVKTWPATVPEEPVLWRQDISRDTRSRREELLVPLKYV